MGDEEGNGLSVHLIDTVSSTGTVEGGKTT